MNRKILVMVFCLLTLTGNIFGQIIVVTKAEYDEIDAIHEKTRNVSRIITTLTNKFSEGKLESVEKLVKEYLSPARYKWTFYKTKDGIMKRTLEIIYYDEKEFRRENEGEWKEINRSSVGGGPVSISGSEIKNLKQYAIGNSMLENKSVRLFSYYRVYDFGKYLNFYDSVIWVNTEGFIIKELSKESNIFPENIIRKIETIYEYNPTNLKLSIPTLEKKEKQ